MSIIKYEDKKLTAKKIIETYAGCPNELKRQFKANNLRYVKTKIGFNTFYKIRNTKGSLILKIKL